MIYQISAIIATLAFVSLVIAVIITLRSVKKTVDQTHQLFNDVSSDVKELLKKSSQLVEETQSTMQLTQEVLSDTRSVVEGTVTEVQERVRKLDNLFSAAETAGDQLKHVSTLVAKEAEANSNRIGKVISLVSAGIDLARKFQKK